MGWFDDVTSSINPFDDEEGMFQGKYDNDVERQAAQVAARGKPKAGAGPDINNYSLNNDGSGIAGQQQLSYNIGQNAVAAGDAVGAGARAYGQSIQGQADSRSRNLDQSAYGATLAGQELSAQAQQAQTRGAPTVDYSGANQALAGAGQAGQSQMGIAQQLAGQANRDTGSAAQAQMQQGTNEAINAAMSIAKSGNGFGGSAASLAQAAQQAPGAIANQANQSAMLRAGEDQANAQRQLQALGAAGQAYQGAGAQALQGGQLSADMQQRAAGLQLQGMAQNDALELGRRQAALGYTQTGLQGSTEAQQLGMQGSLAAAQLGTDATLAGLQYGTNAAMQGQQLGMTAEELQLQRAIAERQGYQDYEQQLTDIYAIDSGATTAAQANETQKQGNALGVLGAAGGAVAGAAMLSDERAKANIETKSLRERYAALSGARA
jgi:hypothetical protein